MEITCDEFKDNYLDLLDKLKKPTDISVAAVKALASQLREHRQACSACEEWSRSLDDVIFLWDKPSAPTQAPNPRLKRTRQAPTIKRLTHNEFKAEYRALSEALKKLAWIIREEKGERALRKKLIPLREHVKFCRSCKNWLMQQEDQ